MWFYVGALLLVIVGILHSYLGEKYLLIRLFKRGNLPKILGSESFTQNTLRFAWHLTTIAWFGFAVILGYLAQDKLELKVIGGIICLTFFAHTLASLIGAKGKHFSWLFFVAITFAIWIAVFW